MADPAILESYKRDSYKELVDAGVTDDETRWYSYATSAATFTGGMDAGGLSLLFTVSFLYLFLAFLFRLSSFVSAPPTSATHESRSVCFLLSR